MGFWGPTGVDGPVGIVGVIGFIIGGGTGCSSGLLGEAGWASLLRIKLRQ